jgi:hypothetical protein
MQKVNLELCKSVDGGRKEIANSKVNLGMIQNSIVVYNQEGFSPLKQG